MAFWDVVLDLAPTVLEVGGGIAGGLLGSDANEKAAKQAAEAQIQAAELNLQAGREARAAYEEAAKRGIGAITAGGTAMRAGLAPLAIRAGPGEMTPQQRIMLEDLMRGGVARLASGGLRGAGRAGQAVLNDLAQRTQASFYDINQQNKDRYRSEIARSYAGEGADIAGIETGTGARSGAAITGAAAAAAPYYAGAGETRANATTANADMWGSTIGGISSIIARDLADRDRYARPNPYAA